MDFYASASDRGKFKGFVRMSPNLFKSSQDGELILRLMREAEHVPVSRPVDAKKLARKPFFNAERKKGETIATVVSVPESDDTGDVEAPETPFKTDVRAATTRHTEIQHRLMTLGAEM